MSNVRRAVQAQVSAEGRNDQARFDALLDALDECAAVAADENEHELKVALRALIDRHRCDYALTPPR